jgi:hypothetical protein
MTRKKQIYRFTDLQIYIFTKFQNLTTDRRIIVTGKYIDVGNEFNNIDINSAIGKLRCVLCMCVDDGVTK